MEYNLHMSTNFYAELEIGQNVTYKLHIGKRSSNGISTFNGKHFPSVAAWEEFLRFNEPIVKIVDEYGTEHNLEKFIEDEFYVPGSSDRQIQWLRENLSDFVGIADEPQKNPRASKHWIDKDGYLFYKGEFS